MWLLTRGGCGRPDGIGTVLHEEWDSFLAVKDRLRRLVENQLTNFRLSIVAVLAMKTGGSVLPSPYGSTHHSQSLSHSHRQPLSPVLILLLALCSVY